MSYCCCVLFAVHPTAVLLCTLTSLFDVDGATTVAGTMAVADMAGIRVFVTGGIGGVHRGAEESFDVSADLTELGRTPVAVVCAGAKQILDMKKTIEVLETQGVPVVGFGTDEFPAFYSRHSGLGHVRSVLPACFVVF
jgi:pseudouridylate synthase